MAGHGEATPHRLFRASRFWTFYSGLNLRQVSQSGPENVKWTVNQNYFNWIPRGAQDHQFRNLARFWAEDPALDVLGVQLDGDATVETVRGADALGSPEARELYRVFVGLLRQCTRRTCPVGLTARRCRSRHAATRCAAAWRDVRSRGTSPIRSGR